MSINLYWYLLNWINTISVFRYYSQIVKCATFFKSLNSRSACKKKITTICISTKFMATLLDPDSVKLHSICNTIFTTNSVYHISICVKLLEYICENYHDEIQDETWISENKWVTLSQSLTQIGLLLKVFTMCYFPYVVYLFMNSLLWEKNYDTFIFVKILVY